jgi:ABC-type multidrug transport system ATPase subunit
MDRIVLENIAKRYAREWIFRGVNLELLRDNAYVILGANGSGKSTLLQVIASYLTPTKGKLQYFSGTEEIPTDKVYHQLSVASPYMELIEEFTLTEYLNFHRELKSFYQDLQVADVIKIMELEHAGDKTLGNYSSGMKQRVKLGTAILTQSDLLLLDEPTSNFDARAIDWYRDLINSYRKDRIVVVCSNHIKAEYDFCPREIVMEDFKNKA